MTRLRLDSQELVLHDTGDTGFTVDEIVTLDGRQFRLTAKAVPVADRPYDLCEAVGLVEDALLDALRTRPFVRVEVSKGGVGLGMVVQMDGSLRAMLKPEQVSPHAIPRYEVAAYRLARALGLSNVPPTVLRTVSRDELFVCVPPELHHIHPRIDAEARFDNDGRSIASVMAWATATIAADVTSMEAFRQRTQWLSLDGALPPAMSGLAAELSTMMAFDLVINNGDRMTGGNVLAPADGLSTIWIDHGFAFGTQTRSRALSHFRRCQRFSKRFIAALRTLDDSAIADALVGEADLLDDAEIAATLERTTSVLAAVDALVAAHGEARVLAFE